MVRLPPGHVGRCTHVNCVVSTRPEFLEQDGGPSKARPPAPVHTLQLNLLRHAPHNAFSLAKAQAIELLCTEKEHMAWPVHFVNIERRAAPSPTSSCPEFFMFCDGIFYCACHFAHEDVTTPFGFVRKQFTDFVRPVSDRHDHTS